MHEPGHGGALPEITPSSLMVHGVTDAGGIARVVLAGPDAQVVAAGIGAGRRPEWWPALGFTYLPGTHDPELTISVDTSLRWSMDRAESDLGLFAAEHLADWVAVHAALVRVGGVVIMLPGSSFAGKSTLCAAVLDAGGDVLSDEYALVALDGGRVAGWPRRVRLRDGQGASLRVGAASGGEVGAVDLIAVVRWDPDCNSALEVVATPPAEVVTEVLANTVCAASRPREAFDAVVTLCRSTPGVVGSRGEAAAALEALLSLDTRQ